MIGNAIGSVADPKAAGSTGDYTAIALLKAILDASGGGGVASTLVHGQKTVAAAGTEEALASSTALTAGVRVKALHGNTGWVYVGKNPVTSSTGFVLDAGEEVFIEIDNLATVYIDVSVNGEGVSYIGS